MGGDDPGHEQHWGRPYERRLIRAWLRERGSEVPVWVLILQAAEEWGCPPWVVEEQCSVDWWSRWVMWREEVATVRKANDKSSGNSIADRFIAPIE